MNDLIPYARNARTHSPAQITKIASSIKEYGWTNPILVDGANGIIAGHGRVEAAKKLGLTEVPTLELSGLSDAQKRAYILADNRLALDAGWDEELLQIELADLKLEGINLENIGFSEGELDELLISDDPVDAPDAEAPEPKADPISKPGDVWTLGAHRLMCGDSTSATDIEKLFEGCSASLYLTDPPYNISHEGRTKNALKIKNDSMESGAFGRFLADAFSMADTVMEPGAAFYIWHSDSEEINFRSACRDVGWTIRESLIWVKNMFTLGRQDYQWRHEPCLYGWKEGAAHKWYSDRSQSTVLEFDKPARNDVHPTMKPVELFRYLMENSSKKGDRVFDGFGGSGTTLIAAEQAGRVAYLMELDPVYADVIIKRWQEATGKEAVRDDGKTYNSLA